MGPRIVVVDDDQGIADVLTLVLEEEGYAVATARDGATALALARYLRPALVLADVRMPGLDGVGLARQLAALPGTPIAILR